MQVAKAGELHQSYLATFANAGNRQWLLNMLDVEAAAATATAKEEEEAKEAAAMGAKGAAAAKGAEEAAASKEAEGAPTKAAAEAVAKGAAAEVASGATAAVASGAAAAVASGATAASKAEEQAEEAAERAAAAVEEEAAAKEAATGAAGKRQQRDRAVRRTSRVSNAPVLYVARSSNDPKTDKPRAVTPKPPGVKLLGRSVEKHFEGHGQFLGFVQGYSESTGFRVCYSDGDEEDMAVDSLLKILVKPGVTLRSPKRQKLAPIAFSTTRVCTVSVM